MNMPNANLLMLRNANIFAPEPLGLQDIFIVGSTIHTIGQELPALPNELQALELNLQGQRVIPGLIDAHVHMTGGGGESGFESRVPPLALSQITTAGVTTAVGVLGTDGVTRSVENLVATAKGLSVLGLSAYCYTGNYQVPPPTLTGSVRKDIVFVDPIIGIGEVAISDHRSSQPTFEEIIRLASDAHVAGLITGKAGVLHLHMGDGKRGLDFLRRALQETELPPRTFHPTHCNRNPQLWEEAKDIAKEGITADVTAFPYDEDDIALYAPDTICEWLDKDLPKERLTVSSDGGGCLPIFDKNGNMLSMDIGKSASLTHCLKEVLDRGRALQDVLPFFTSNVAKQFRFHKKGELKVGNDADLVVLDEKHSIQDVLCKGQWMVRQGEAIKLGLFEPKKS